MRKLAAWVIPMVVTGLMATAQSSGSEAPMIAKAEVVFRKTGMTGTQEGGLYHFLGSHDTSGVRGLAVGASERMDTVSPINWKMTGYYSKPFPTSTFMLSAAMVAYGAAGLKMASLQSLNHKIREEVWIEDPHARFHADNYLMYVPAASVYALNALGIHGEHNLKDRTILLLMSQVFAQGTVFSLKSWTHTLRPDGSAYNSFPSGHTAEAFANAEFLRQEYKDVSPWYGIAGYAVATTTGMLRMYNNKHWLNDVVAGAGIGIASTRLAYWLYPRLQHWVFHDKSPGTMLTPSYNNGAIGLSFAKTF